MDKMREEFERWASSEFGTNFPAKHHEAYRNVKEFSWNVWKSSRAALCVELPSFENGSLRGYSGDCEEANMIVDSVAEKLEKAGVSCK